MSPFLLLAALFPAAALLVRVYRLDKIEKEPPRVLWTLIGCGALAAMAAYALHCVLLRLLDGRLAEQGRALGLRGLELELVVGILIEHVDRRLVDELVGHIITSYKTSGVDGFGSYLTPNNRSP